MLDSLVVARKARSEKSLDIAVRVENRQLIHILRGESKAEVSE
jgi:hypothetical protein